MVDGGSLIKVTTITNCQLTQSISHIHKNYTIHQYSLQNSHILPLHQFPVTNIITSSSPQITSHPFRDFTTAKTLPSPLPSHHHFTTTITLSLSLHHHHYPLTITSPAPLPSHHHFTSTITISPSPHPHLTILSQSTMKSSHKPSPCKSSFSCCCLLSQTPLLSPHPPSPTHCCDCSTGRPLWRSCLSPSSPGPPSCLVLGGWLFE